MSNAIQTSPMTESEARECADEIRRHLDGARPLILALYERQGWKALGYSSWRECVIEEFGFSQSHLYRHLKAAEIERDISPIGEIGSIPEGQLRPLGDLPSDQRRDAWEEAKTASPDRKPTAKQVQAVVDRKLGKPEPEPEPQSPPTPTARINGVDAADPPDVAALRAAGRIPEGAIVEIDDPEPEEVEPEPEPASPADEPSDEEWLDSLPLSGRLTGPQRKVFRRDALLYRRLERHRKTYQHHFRRDAKAAQRSAPGVKAGEYESRTASWLRLNHPKDWRVCQAVEQGGCNGTGSVELIGACLECNGRGYRVTA